MRPLTLSVRVAHGRLGGLPVWLLAWLTAAVVGVLVPFGMVVMAAAAALVAVIGLLALAPVLRSPVSSIHALLIVALLIPVEFNLGTSIISVTVPLAAAIILAWLVRLLQPRAANTISRSATTVTVLAFMGAALLAFAVGQFPWFPTDSAPLRAQLAGVSVFLLSGGVFLVVAHDVATVSQLRRITWSFLAASAVVVAGSALPPVPPWSLVTWMTGPETVGSAFWTWTVALGASQAVFNAELRTGTRLALALLTLATLGRGLLVGFSWVSGWLPPLVALVVVLGCRFPRIAIVAAFFAVPATMAGLSVLPALVDGESYSLLTRSEAAHVLWPLIERNVWLGYGPANYYYYTTLFPILGWYVHFSSHNQYIDLLVQTGLLGTATFVAFGAAIGHLTWRLRRTAFDGFTKAYLAGALGGLVGTLVSGFLADWIVPFVYNIGLRGFRTSLLFWFFLGGVVAISRMPRLVLVPEEAP